MQWDIFCRVIDNYGDLGVCWRLAADLGARGHRVRLWIDDPSGLQWMAPGALQGHWLQVQVLPWEQSKDLAHVAALPPADVWIEAFGCEIATEFIAFHARIGGSNTRRDAKPLVWINLEYLSAEPFVERCHGLPSPILSGPAAGWTKYFFYPGFTAKTGGLLREPDLGQRQQALEANPQAPAWLSQYGIDRGAELLICLFCYEPPALPALLALCGEQSKPVHLLVAAGRSQAAVRAALGADQTTASLPLRNLRITYLPPLTQTQFDELLWACDLNFVRGEDSLVRALWAGKPLVWNIYAQDDDAHVAKLDAFLDLIGADASLRAFHLAWNGTRHLAEPAALPLIDLKAWSQTVQKARLRQLQSDDLLTQLVHFVLKKR